MPPHTRVFDRRVLYPGEVLIREGDYGDSAYYVQSGQVGVYKQAGDVEVLITVLPGNSIVGEMALIDNCRRSATVRCLETATVITVNRATFERKMERLDPLMRALLEMFTQKIRRLNDDYCSVERKLQWLLRQTGLPPKPAGSRWVTQPPPAVEARPGTAPSGDPKPATAGEPPAPTALPTLPGPGIGPFARAAVSELNRVDIDRFDRLKLELAMLYHPDCTGERTNETMKRADVFHEIWTVLQKIEDDYCDLA